VESAESIVLFNQLQRDYGFVLDVLIFDWRIAFAASLSMTVQRLLHGKKSSVTQHFSATMRANLFRLHASFFNPLATG
jgi:hypothetical protein